MTTPQAALPSDVYATFCGGIDQASLQRLFAGFATAMEAKVGHVHLLFQSTGGYVNEGIALYNYFSTLPIPLTLYNAGGVSSIGTIAYLGAQKRKVSAHATFMIHRTYRQEFATAARLKTATQNLVIDDQRTEAILRKHVTLTDEQWTALDYQDVMLNATDAIKAGFAQELGEFAPPFGQQVYNLL